MDHITQLRVRERRLRARVRATTAPDHVTTDAERRWIVRELRVMDALVDLFIGTVPEHDREYERYRLEFELPTFVYLRRTYGLFYPEAVDIAG